MNKLEAIQLISRRVGERPPAALDTDGASKAADIERVLDDEELRIQGDGWAYNEHEKVTIARDVSNQIPVPSGCLLIDSSGKDGWRKVAQRGSFLFDITNNSSTFDYDLECDYTIRYEFECIPIHVQQYIVACAAARYNDERQSATEEMKRPYRRRLAEEEARNKVAAMRLDQEVSDVNVLHTEDALKVRGRSNTTDVFGFDT